MPQKYTENDEYGVIFAITQVRLSALRNSYRRLPVIATVRRDVCTVPHLFLEDSLYPHGRKSVSLMHAAIHTLHCGPALWKEKQYRV
jgi:hypothetical protein